MFSQHYRQIETVASSAKCTLCSAKSW